MLYFALRQKSTGKFLTRERATPRISRWPLPGTWMELAHEAERLPRLFMTRAAAVGALSYWLSGKYVKKHDVVAGELLGSHPERAPEDMQEKRDPSDFEVVRVELKLYT